MRRPLPVPFHRWLSLAAFAVLPVAGLYAEQGSVKIDGSSTVYPITKAAAEAFEKETGGKIDVDVAFSGTTAGFRKFIKGETDISDASRPILKKEMEQAKANGIEFIEIPIAYDALTVAVNPELDWLNSITTSELKKMWEPSADGKITKWSQINPDWPDEKFTLLGAGGDSGTYDYFAEVITGGKTLRSDFDGSEDDTEIVEGIATNDNALGFLPHSYLVAAKGKIKPLAISHNYDAETNQTLEGQPVPPSNRAVFQGIYSPLGRPLFIYVSVKSLEEKPAVREFLTYFLQNAPQFINEANYLPLSEVAYLGAQNQLRRKETGSRFDGTPVTGISLHNMLSLQPKPL
ncbi:MAG: PstS family phosphate ABC transporter substrate-binding protein [Verrucomicrobiota bacterium]